MLTYCFYRFNTTAAAVSSGERARSVFEHRREENYVGGQLFQRAPSAPQAGREKPEEDFTGRAGGAGRGHHSESGEQPQNFSHNLWGHLHFCL